MQPLLWHNILDTILGSSTYTSSKVVIRVSDPNTRLGVEKSGGSPLQPLHCLGGTLKAPELLINRFHSTTTGAVVQGATWLCMHPSPLTSGSRPPSISTCPRVARRLLANPTYLDPQAGRIMAFAFFGGCSAILSPTFDVQGRTQRTLKAMSNTSS